MTYWVDVKGRHLKIGACNSRNRLELAVNFLGAGVYWVDQVPEWGDNESEMETDKHAKDGTWCHPIV